MNLRTLIHHVIFKVKNAFPGQIAVVLDGWLLSSTHCLDSAATYPSGSTEGHPQALLAFSPLENEALPIAVEHVNILKFVVQLNAKKKRALLQLPVMIRTLIEHSSSVCV